MTGAPSTPVRVAPSSSATSRRRAASGVSPGSTWAPAKSPTLGYQRRPGARWRSRTWSARRRITATTWWVSTGGLLEGQGVGRGRDAAAAVEGGAGQEALEDAVVGAVGGQVTQRPQLAQGHAELGDQDAVQEAEGVRVRAGLGGPRSEEHTSE